MRQLAPIVSTLTWFAKARTGKLKSIPQSTLGEQRKPGSIAETSMMQRFQAVHIEASDAMFSIYMRKFDLPLRQTMWPHKFNGTDEAHQMVQSVKGIKSGGAAATAGTRYWSRCGVVWWEGASFG